MNFSEICFSKFRLDSFDDSIFKKNRRKCTPKNMVEAGFYFSPTNSKTDQVICYACGTEIYGWEKDDDPWTEHLKIKSDCMYLLKKVSYEKQLTLSEFLEIEQYRFERLAEKNYYRKRSAILNASKIDL